MTQFKNDALKQLTDQQVRFAPPTRRQEQLARAEKLLAEIEPKRQYPYQFVCYRVTDYRPDSYGDLLISGEDLKHDLCAFMDELSRSLPVVPVEEVTEKVLTLEQISQQFNVSTKTISRWRERGLIARRVLCNGKRQLAFPQSTIDRFLATNQNTVERGARFSQLTEDEKEEILRRAKRLSRVGGGSLTEISRRIARRLKRSPETVRYTIKNYDREHPEAPLFPDVAGPLTDDMKDAIYTTYRRLKGHDGVIEMLAKRFRRTRTSMYRIINEMRARQLLRLPLEYIPHPSFDAPNAEAEIMAPMPDAEAYEMQRRQTKVPKDAPPELAPLYEVPLLSKPQEQHLFRQMNYLKHKAVKLRDQLDPIRARIQELAAIEELQKQASAVKERLVKSNMRLVVSIAKKHAGQADNFFELQSDGNMSLIRAVEKFDFSRGNKFSTYASWAIMKNFARSIPDEKRHRERYVTGHEDMFEAAPDVRTNEQEISSKQEQAKLEVHDLLERLDPREREIIRMRAGLDNYSEGMTLEEIGQQLGITKERVRQLHVRIMKKLEALAGGGRKSEQ
jgi:RNA polymerase sigma factor (sigma-70 family)